MKIPEQIDGVTLIGAKCCQAKLTLLGLTIGFGYLVPYKMSKLKEKEKGVLEIHSDFNAWRIFQHGELVVGNEDKENILENVLEELIGQEILKVEIPEKLSDATITLSGGIRIELFQVSIHDVSWSLSGSETLIEIGPGERIRISNRENPNSLTNQEEIVSVHAEECAKRWEKIVPNVSIEGKCKKCAYYCALQGRFYFWDFGICSNPSSRFDGKVTNVSSGCEKWKSEINLNELQ